MAPPSPAECERRARIGGLLFRKRSWLPVPFLLALVVIHADLTVPRALIAVALVTLGEGWRLWAVAVAGTETRRRGRRVRCLVTSGPFAWHRNPLYCGNFIIWMAVVTFSGVLWFLPIAAAVFALEYFFIVRYEEAVLESHFGETYLEYRAATHRWLPHPPGAKARARLRWREAWLSESSTFLQYAALIVVFLGKQFWLHQH